jgi:hypothetical protein
MLFWKLLAVMFYRLSMHLVGGGETALVFILWFFYLFYRTHEHPVLGRIIAVFIHWVEMRNLGAVFLIISRIVAAGVFLV